MRPKSYISKNLSKIISEIVTTELEVLSLDRTLKNYYEKNSFGQKGDRGNINVPQINAAKLKWLLIQLLDIIDDLLVNYIESDDYMQPEHWGFKPSGALGYFDIGFGNYYTGFEQEPEEISVNNDGDDYVAQIFNKLGIKSYMFLGGGSNGSAYDIGSGKVLKITRDRSEAVNCQKLIGKKLNNIADVYLVKQFAIPGGNPKYVILLEKLNHHENLSKWYNGLSEIFDMSRNKHFKLDIINSIQKTIPMLQNFLKQ